jgi:hypothetical protein
MDALKESERITLVEGLKLLERPERVNDCETAGLLI